MSEYCSMCGKYKSCCTLVCDKCKSKLTKLREELDMLIEGYRITGLNLIDLKKLRELL